MLIFVCGYRVDHGVIACFPGILRVIKLNQEFLGGIRQVVPFFCTRGGHAPQRREACCEIQEATRVSTGGLCWISFSAEEKTRRNKRDSRTPVTPAVRQADVRYIQVRMNQP